MNELIKTLEKIERYFEYYPVKRNNSVAEINMQELIKIDPDLPELIENNPELLDMTSELIKKHVVIVNYPDFLKIKVDSIRKDKIDKFTCFDAIIVKVGEICPIAKSIKYECVSCGKVINIEQKYSFLSKPKRCGCGSQGFNRLEIEWENVQKVIVEEFIKDYTNKSVQNVRAEVELKNYLTEKEVNKQIQPGKFVTINGIIRAEVLEKTKKSKFYVEAKNVEVKDFSFFNLKTSDKMVDKFKQVNTDTIIKDITSSLYPDIEGYQKIKEILAISRARGIKTFYPDGKLDERDTINIFLIGSPGTAKSKLSKLTAKLDPIHMVVSGKGVSGVGLTGATIQDKNLNSYCVIPGAVPRCNKGTLVVDEADKISDDDLASLNEGMINHSFMIVKGDQQVTLPADVGIISCANPQGRKFDDYIPKYRQITLKPDYLDRHDVWVAINKDDSESYNKRVIKRMAHKYMQDSEQYKVKYDLNFLRQYYAWIIQTFKPRFNKSVLSYATEEIYKLMGKNFSKEKKNEISFRLVGNILRISTAIAKIKQRNNVIKEDIDQTIEYLIYGFKSLEMIDKTGHVEVGAIDLSEDSKDKKLKYDFLEEIHKMYDSTKKPIPDEDIEDMWESKGGTKVEVEKLLSKLSQRGDILEFKRGYWRPI